MEISTIIGISYFVTGFILAFYWFTKDYKNEYDELVENDIPDRGITSLFLLGLWLFWPIFLVKNIVKHKRI